MFEFLNSSRRVVADTTQIQLRVISVSMIIHAVLVDLLFENSGVHNEQPRAGPSIRSVWYGARDVHDFSVFVLVHRPRSTKIFAVIFIISLFNS